MRGITMGTSGFLVACGFAGRTQRAAVNPLARMVQTKEKIENMIDNIKHILLNSSHELLSYGLAAMVFSMVLKLDLDNESILQYMLLLAVLRVGVHKIRTAEYINDLKKGIESNE